MLSFCVPDGRSILISIVCSPPVLVPAKYRSAICDPAVRAARRRPGWVLGEISTTAVDASRTVPAGERQPCYAVPVEEGPVLLSRS
jgi:hypothetical protein